MNSVAQMTASEVAYPLNEHSSIKKCGWFALVGCVLLIPLLHIAPNHKYVESSCKLLNTTYSFLSSAWHWLSPDEVEFSTSSNFPSGGIYTNATEWYQYKLSTDQLQKLGGRPLQPTALSSNILAKLKNIQASDSGIYEAIHAAKGGEKFIYARAVGNRKSYWFVDLTTGLESDLGIQSVIATANELDTFWFPDENRVIVQSGSNSVMPITLITQQGQTISSKRVADLGTLSSYGPGFRDSGFKVSGVSPDGNYILIQPETQESVFWVYNLTTSQIDKVSFYALGDQRAAWLTNSSFVVMSNKGVIEYDISTRQMNIILSDTVLDIGSLGANSTVSPDGKYILIARLGKDAMQPSVGIKICKL